MKCVNLGPGASVTFHTDHSVVDKGFKIEYEFMDSPGCAKKTLLTTVGVQPVTFTSLNYPSTFNVVYENTS